MPGNTGTYLSKLNITEINIMNNRILEIPDESGGKSLVYYTKPGVESNNNGLKMIYNYLKNGRTCIFVASNTSRAVIKNQFKRKICCFKSRQH